MAFCASRLWWNRCANLHESLIRPATVADREHASSGCVLPRAVPPRDVRPFRVAYLLGMCAPFGLRTSPGCAPLSGCVPLSSHAVPWALFSDVFQAVDRRLLCGITASGRILRYRSTSHARDLRLWTRLAERAEGRSALPQFKASLFRANRPEPRFSREAGAGIPGFASAAVDSMQRPARSARDSRFWMRNRTPGGLGRTESRLLDAFSRSASDTQLHRPSSGACRFPRLVQSRQSRARNACASPKTHPQPDISSTVSCRMRETRAAG